MSTSSINRFAWMTILVLFAGSVVNYMDRAVLSVVMPQVRQDLSLTNTDYGLAVNAFLVLYMVFYILGGRLADWLGCRRSFLIMIAFWSTASMLHAAVRGLLSLCVCRALLGAGEGGFYPTAMRGAAEWFGPKDRAKAVGLLLCGISVGVLITAPLVAWITYHQGWRASFFLTGASGLLLVAIWLWLQRKIRRAFGTPDPAPEYTVEKASEPSAETSLSLRQVLRHPKYWLLLTSRSVTDAAWFFYLFWIPGYFQIIRGFDLRQVGHLLWIPFLFADMGALGGAWASSHLIKHGLGLDPSRKIVLVVSAALPLFGAGTYFVSSHFLALAILSLALFGHFSWAANMHTVITEITPQRHVAVLYGITGAAGTLLGAISQPLVGRVVDKAGYEIPFIASSAAYALAIALLLAAGKIERMRGVPNKVTDSA